MSRRLRLTIVEDVDSDAELMVHKLTESGYQVDWHRVDCEADFLSVLDSPPDIILADWSLPLFSGTRALQILRERGLDIPFIIVSGTIGEEAAVDALRMGAYDYVTKDRPARLPHAVRGALEERQLREERRRSHEALFLLTRAVEQSPVSVIITDRSGNIQYVNPKFVEVSGYTFNEVRGRNPRVLKSNETPAAVYSDLWKTITAGGEWRGELHNRRKDGKLFWERQVISPVRDAGGTISHFVGVKEDITAHKTLEEQLRQAQKLESLGRLAGGIAHDFNNLLTVINGYGDMVLKALPASSPLRDFVTAMTEAGWQAAMLTQQLLAFSRKQHIVLKPVNINESISDVERMLRRLLGEDIQLIIETHEKLGTVMCDAGQLQQVLLNLAVNARDAMPGGGKLIIKTADYECRYIAPRLAGLARGRYACLSVADTGVGMDSETLSHVFEPFFTTKPVGKGTGLGLSTAYGIVKQLGGEITVSSEPGHGTEFQVFLPTIEHSTVIEETTDVSTAVLTGSETVLVVEDNESLRNLVATNLTSYGYRPLVASTAEEALDIAENYIGPIHLLLTDVIMPGSSGRDLAVRLKLLRASTKILFMSGHAHDVISQHGVSESGPEFIAKPFTARELAATVRKVLNSAIQHV